MITQEELKARIHYNPETGVFTYIKNRKKEFVGKVAGFTDLKGYRIITLRGHRYVASILAWLYVYGRLPEGKIRYINDDKKDLRICNLGEAEHKLCQQDLRGPTKANVSGLLGVYWDNGTQKWKSSIRAGGKRIWLGRFDDKHDAYAAYIEAKKIYHPESKLAQCQ
jgi:hypothetical protein